jgi:hypothetical protein
MRHSPEDALQIAVVKLLSYQRVEGLVWTAVNPKPFKTPATAAKSKALGMRAGWPDLMFIYRGVPFAIELKSKHGRPSDVQTGMHVQMEAAGCAIFVCASVEEVLDALRFMDVPINMRVAA